MSRGMSQQLSSGIILPIAQTPRLPMSDQRYEIVIYWSEPDQAFVAEVPGLAGCMADGPVHRAGLAHAEAVIDEWIATAKELGREIPKPRGRLLPA
jgi:predicted RNase H-like HicB family nuclease